METQIEVRELTKSYGTGETAVRALDGVNLDVHSGELLLMLGPSGSGKTTLLSIMGCILSATRGSVMVRGQETVGLKQSKLPQVRLDNIGFIFQGFNLFPALSASENVEIALDLKGIRGRGARRRADELLERVGLSDKLDASPDNLSGGQKQRVAIARALAGDPHIILADEPTAALDSHSGKVVMEMLRDLAHQQGRAVCIVTHDNRAFAYADRIVHIEDGRLREEEQHTVTAQSEQHKTSPQQRDRANEQLTCTH